MKSGRRSTILRRLLSRSQHRVAFPRVSKRGHVAAVERDVVFFHHEGNRAIRMGKWKLVSAREDDNVWELFDLEADRGETTDLAEKHPRRVKEMEAAWQRLEEQYRRQAGKAKREAKKRGWLRLG